MALLGLPDVAVSTMDQMRGLGADADDTSVPEWPLGDAAGVRADDSESDKDASDRVPPAPWCRPCRGSSDDCDAPPGRRRSVRSEDRESSSTSTRSAQKSHTRLISIGVMVPQAAHSFYRARGIHAQKRATKWNTPGLVSS